MLTSDVGTLYYMAPEYVFYSVDPIEQMNPEEYTKLDVWSLGIMLYAFISNGVHPFGLKYDVLPSKGTYYHILKKIITGYDFSKDD